MRIPGQSDQIPVQAVAKRGDLGGLDAVYACYAFLGLGMTAIGIVSTFLKGPTQAGYAMLLLPLVPSMPGVFVATIVLTVMRRHHRSVLVLCLIHLAFLAAIALTDMFSAPGAIETAMDALVLSYGAVFTLVPIWWFTKGRRNRDGGTQPSLS